MAAVPDVDIDLDAIVDEEDEGPIEPEPGSPSLENVAFVVLGVASTIAVVLHLAGLI